MTFSPVPILDPPAGEATLIGSLLLGYESLDAVTALRAEFFSNPTTEALFRAVRARLVSFPDENTSARITAVVKAVPAAHGDMMVAILQLGRYRSVAPLVVPRIIETWLRRELRRVAKTIKRELRAGRLNGEEVLGLAQQRLADLERALP